MTVGIKNNALNLQAWIFSASMIGNFSTKLND